VRLPAGCGREYAASVSFPRKLLHESEDIALDLHPHWWFFAPPLFALVASIVLGVAIWSTEIEWLRIPAAIVILGCLLWFGARYAKWVTTHFVVTTDRLIFRHGVLTKNGIEIPLERVNTVFFRQSLFERMVGSGDLVIESASEQGRQAFSNVRHPDDIQSEIYRQIEDNENRKFDRAGAAARPPASIADQISQLATLRDQGHLTEAEFQAKKTELLGRL
jgi:uncharacterized membrane protein YdbT with pleckstrin-like domain